VRTVVDLDDARLRECLQINVREPNLDRVGGDAFAQRGRCRARAWSGVVSVHALAARRCAGGKGQCADGEERDPSTSEGCKHLGTPWYVCELRCAAPVDGALVGAE